MYKTLDDTSVAEKIAEINLYTYFSSLFYFIYLFFFFFSQRNISTSHRLTFLQITQRFVRSSRLLKRASILVFEKSALTPEMTCRVEGKLSK